MVGFLVQKQKIALESAFFALIYFIERDARRVPRYGLGISLIEEAPNQNNRWTHVIRVSAISSYTIAY